MSEEKLTPEMITGVSSSASRMLEESIKRNREFNKTQVIKNITNPKNSNEDKIARIAQVLKDKGLDSQQRVQALELIREILEN